MRFSIRGLVRFGLLLAVAPVAFATTWYVNGVSGSNTNNCLSVSTACKTIGHAISRTASGDAVLVAAATYKENLTVGHSLTIAGAGPGTTIIDGGGVATVVTVSNANARVGLSYFTIRNGRGGIYNSGILTINRCTISGNSATGGGGIFNHGTLTVSDSTVSGNSARGMPGLGGGIANLGTATINGSTITGNTVSGVFGAGFGGGIGNNGGNLAVNNSTLTGNTATAWGGGIGNESGNLTINNSTISGNKESSGGVANYSGVVILQNSIVANNSGGDCYNRTAISSHGYNLSGDATCDFDGAGDLNGIDPKLGTLGYYGGPTQTIPLLSGSPAIDAGNPSGCRDSNGNLLTTDQRGMPRPDTEDAGGCDMGAFEEQSDTGYCIPQGGLCFGPGGNACCPAPRGHHSYCSNPTGYGTCVED